MRFFKINFSEIIIILLCVSAFAFAFSSPNALAAYFDEYVFDNSFGAFKYLSSLEEKFIPPQSWRGETLEKSAGISNDSEENTDIYARVAVIEKNISEDEEHLSIQKRRGNRSVERVVKNWNSESGLELQSMWQHLSDGWYYYKKTISPGESVKIIDSVTANSSNLVSGASYELTFVAETILADAEAVKKMWNCTVSPSDEKGFYDWSLLI